MVDLSSYVAVCEWSQGPWFMVATNAANWVMYSSHLVPAILALLLGVFVLQYRPRARLNQYFFVLTILFAAWLSFDLLFWLSVSPAITVTAASLLILLESLIFLTVAAFSYAALTQQQLQLKTISLFAVLLLPIIIFLPTSLAVENFDLTNCAGSVSKGWLVYYGYFLQLVIILSIAIKTLRYSIEAHVPETEKARVIAVVIGALFFLSLISLYTILYDWYGLKTFGQYELFLTPIFLGFIALFITRLREFNTEFLNSDISAGLLAILTLGVVFIEDMVRTSAVAFATYALIALLGFIVVRAVRKDLTQRRTIAELERKLVLANKRIRQIDKMKSEFVSIASHQLRSPLTSIRGYVSMLLEGTYGKIPKKASAILEHIADASRYMALSVEDYLNVSRIQSGNMKYEMTDFNLRDLAEEIADEMRQETIRRGLLLTFKTKLSGKAIVHADIGKTRQVIQNLIDNALKYTPKGTIKVLVRDDKKTKKIYIDVSDSGIGMSEETIHAIFEKFERARNANDVNVTGTGLGLYIAQTMAQAMGGDVTANSEGEGLGSTFSLEMPYEM